MQTPTEEVNITDHRRSTHWLQMSETGYCIWYSKNKLPQVSLRKGCFHRVTDHPYPCGCSAGLPGLFVRGLCLKLIRAKFDRNQKSVTSRYKLLFFSLTPRNRYLLDLYYNITHDYATIIIDDDAFDSLRLTHTSCPLVGLNTRIALFRCFAVFNVGCRI